MMGTMTREAGSGQAEGFAAFVSAATPRLGRTARLLTADPHLAQDLVQATLLAVYLRWPTVREMSAPAAYAQRVLYTTFWSWRGRRWVGERPTEHLPEVPGADPFRGSDTGAVHAALRRLPRRQRAVVVARFYDDLSVEQTAQLLGCSTGTVKSQTARALQALRAALGDPEEES
jgi:RNA polymerase sigma-70 factor (sigma-E family)